MGWKLRGLSFLAGLLFLFSGLWPIGFTCLAYFALSFRSRRPSKVGAPKRSSAPSLRLVAGGALLLLSAIALLSGGVLSPLVFFVSGAVALSWPTVAGRLSARVSPVGGSILLRSKHLLFEWFALAEVKAGPEQYPRAVSALEGALVIFTHTGRVFSLVRCFALTKSSAESILLSRFRSEVLRCAAGAYLLPLDSNEANGVLQARLSRASLRGRLVESPPLGQGILAIECHEGFVSRAAAYEITGSSESAWVPSSGSQPEPPPLVWEVMEALSRRTRWPDPDAFSNLLDSLTATMGVPLGERIGNLEDSGAGLVVHTVSGEEVHTSRPQIRAIVSIYS